MRYNDEPLRTLQDFESALQALHNVGPRLMPSATFPFIASQNRVIRLNAECVSRTTQRHRRCAPVTQLRRRRRYDPEAFCGPSEQHPSDARRTRTPAVRMALTRPSERRVRNPCVAQRECQHQVSRCAGYAAANHPLSTAMNAARMPSTANMRIPTGARSARSTHRHGDSTKTVLAAPRQAFTKPIMPPNRAASATEYRLGQIPNSLQTWNRGLMVPNGT